MKEGSMAKARKNSSDELVRTIASALEPIPYWVGFKHARYWKHGLPEAAIVAELREALLARCRDGETVFCEVAYLDLGLKSAQKGAGRPLQADLVIAGKGTKRKPGKFVAVIEVKRGDVLDAAAQVDLAYLKQLRNDTAGRFRTFLVLVTESGRPKDGLTERGTADRRFAIEGFPGVLVRRVVRAIGHAAEYEDGLPKDASSDKQSQHWAVLYEVY
jgi:hypothetical protein